MAGDLATALFNVRLTRMNSAENATGVTMYVPICEFRIYEYKQGKWCDRPCLRKAKYMAFDGSRICGVHARAIDHYSESMGMDREKCKPLKT